MRKMNFKWRDRLEDTYSIVNFFYDHHSTTALGQPGIACHEGSQTGELSYFEEICRVIYSVLEVFEAEY
jgi:diaminopimelate decarboxylase